MREILFRGKRITDNAWIKGDLQTLKKGWGPFITIKGNGDKVFPETVGQYTGLKDKNGKRIFEGDIVRGDNWLHSNIKIYEVAFNEACFYLVDDSGTMWHHDHIENVEVIGNIHDNKELLHDCEV